MGAPRTKLGSASLCLPMPAVPSGYQFTCAAARSGPKASAPAPATTRRRASSTHSRTRYGQSCSFANLEPSTPFGPSRRALFCAPNAYAAPNVPCLRLMRVWRFKGLGVGGTSRETAQSSSYAWRVHRAASAPGSYRRNEAPSGST